MTPRQRERFLKLASEEISKTKPTNEELWEEIEKIRQELNAQKFDEVVVSPDEEVEVHYKEIEYKDPKILNQFLIAFNSDSILKYTCHLIDKDALESINKQLSKIKRGYKPPSTGKLKARDLPQSNGNEYDYQKHLKLIKNNYYNLVQQYAVDKNIQGKIGEYLSDYMADNELKGWSEDKIRINWSETGLQEWCHNNPGKCPNPDPGLKYAGYEFAPVELKNGDTLNNFSDVVLLFKKQIQFRASHSLKSCLQRINYNFKDEADIDITNVQENIELFTDTEKVLQAYTKVIVMSIEFHKETQPTTKPVFQISFKEEGRAQNAGIFLRVHHINSSFGKTVNNLIDRLGEKMSVLIEKQVNGLCDFSITADFKNKEYCELRIWPTPREIIKEHKEFDGVSFNLKFYRG